MSKKDIRTILEEGFEMEPVPLWVWCVVYGVALVVIGVTL